jgi:hypothetical protein
MLARLATLARERFAIDHTTFQIEVRDADARTGDVSHCAEASGACSSVGLPRFEHSH